MQEQHSVTVCPKCRYRRQKSDTAPKWQCPECGVAYAKVQRASRSAIHPATGRIMAQPENRYGKGAGWHTVFSLFVLLGIVLFIVAWWQKSTLPDASVMLPEMQNEPLQTAMQKAPFVFAYRGASYQVVPVARYEIWGLVVSHNNISGWTDIMHDENSVDLKDICIIWGSNLQTNDFRKVSYSSGDFVCYFRYPYGVSFAHDKLSNNHLLSDNPAVREVIRNVKVGDQIHMRGMLVNYSPVAQPGWWRNTSTTRKDTGNGACEVVFVKDFQVLRSSNALWYNLYTTSAWLILLTLILKLVSYYFLPAGKIRQH